jgi:hypothetical protein
MRRRLININAKSVEIVPDDLQHTTCKDAGSAENAGAIFSRSILGDTLKSFLTIFSIHSILGDNIFKNEELIKWEYLSH